MCVLTDYSVPSNSVKLVYKGNKTLITIVPLRDRSNSVIGIQEFTITYRGQSHSVVHSDRPIWLEELPFDAARILYDTWTDYFSWPQYDNNPDFHQAKNILGAVLNAMSPDHVLI